MPTITRHLPQSNEKRLVAVTSAKTKNDNLAAGIVILTAATVGRLNLIQPQYLAGTQTVASATAGSTNATAVKDAAQHIARMWTSHYYQALNNAIDRGIYPASVRAFFNLDVNSDAVPVMDSEAKVKLWGERVSSGEAAMIAAAHPAMPYPSEPTVKAKVNDFKAKLILQSTAMDATDAAEEALDARNEEADKVIKKVWDEVETFYNEETVESMRNNARQWGVVYVTLGDITNVTFRAVSSADGAVVQDVEFKILSTGNVYSNDDADSVTIETRLVGDEDVKATHLSYQPLTQTITIVESQAMTVTFTLVPL